MQTVSIPIEICKEKQFHILQSSSRSLYQIEKCQIKPQTNQFEFSSPFSSQLTDPQKADEYGLGLKLLSEKDKKQDKKEELIPVHHPPMQSMPFQTTPVPGSGPTGDYCLLKIENNQCYLYPVSHFLQSQPNFQFLDALRHYEKQQQQIKDDSEIESSAAEEKDQKKVTLLQKKQDVNIHSASHKRMLQRKQIEEEDWVQLQSIDDH